MYVRIGPSSPPPAPRWLACIALVLLVAGGCSDEPEAPARTAPRPAKLVEIAAAERVTVLSLPAIVESSTSAELAFQVAGRVEVIAVDEGDRVEEGTEIARLDQRDLQIELDTALTNYEAAEADFRRAESLLAKGAISRAAYDQEESRRDVSRAKRDAARKRFDDSVLRAPFTGIVATVHTEAFQNASPGQAVVTLQTTGAMEAVVQVPATLVAESKRIEPRETSVVLDAAPGTPMSARFHSIATRADPAQQTFEARFAFTPPADLVILPGMTGTVRSAVAFTGETRVSVPIEAILSEADARYVWVVDPESMTVSKREVTLGDGAGATLPVLAGLAAGETVVAAGVSHLHDGMRIRRYEP